MIGLILLLVYSALQGLTDSVLWSRKGHEAYEHNEHIGLWGGRLIVFILAVLKVNPVIAIGALLLFPFIHSGCYYEGRKIISEGQTYPDGWKSEPSEDSSAKINFSFKQRTYMALAGILVITLYLFFKT